MKKIKLILKPILFILIFAVIFSYLSNLFVRKTLDGAWNHTHKISGFYNEPENEFDIMFFGSSNTYCSFNPLVLYEQSGLKSYVFASQQQPVWASYTYMKEALKTQKPQLMVMDVLMFTKNQEYYDDGVNYSYMDDIPFSKNKAELAFSSAPFPENIRLLVNFIKYHTRWSELTEEDYEFDRKKTADYLKGYVLLEETFPDALPPVSSDGIADSLSQKESEYLYKIIKLAKDNDIPLLLVKTPSNATQEEQAMYNKIAEIAKDEDVPYINYNSFYEGIGLSMAEDFYDKSHLNYKGADKFTRFFIENISFTFENADFNNDDWNKNLQKYKTYISDLN